MTMIHDSIRTSSQSKNKNGDFKLASTKLDWSISVPAN